MTATAPTRRRGRGLARLALVASIALAAAWPARRAHAESSAPRRTSWSFHLGLGFFDMAAANGSTTAELRGPGFDLGLAGGVRVGATPFAVFGELGGTVSPASYLENGASKDIGDILATRFMLSAGAMYWIRRVNVFIAAAGGPCQLRVQERDSTVALAESHLGPGAFVEVGKQWNGPLGVATALRFSYGSGVQIDRDWSWHAFAIALTAHVGYTPFWAEAPVVADRLPGHLK